MTKKKSDKDEPTFDEITDEIYKIINEGDKLLWFKLALRRWDRRLAALLDRLTSNDDKPAAPKHIPFWRQHLVALFGLLFKVLKTANVAKPALLGMSLAGWTLISSWEFAVTIIAVIMFHEYGHVRAMKKYEIPTRGMYLIPFVGGIAIGDKPKTHWQDVYISMMGPFFGLFMTIACYLLYLATGSEFAGLVAVVSGLINVFNLLPVYPLDGGRVIKSMVVSMNRSGGLFFLIGLSIVALVYCMEAGLYFFPVIIIIGLIDTIVSLRASPREDLLALTAYGIVFSLIWYLFTIIAFIVLIYMIAASDLAGSDFVTTILES